jgi:hypothetical protein
MSPHCSPGSSWPRWDEGEAAPGGGEQIVLRKCPEHGVGWQTQRTAVFQNGHVRGGVQPHHPHQSPVFCPLSVPVTGRTWHSNSYSEPASEGRGSMFPETQVPVHLEGQLCLQTGFVSNRGLHHGSPELVMATQLSPFSVTSI